jgi:hypothetical protein
VVAICIIASAVTKNPKSCAVVLWLNIDMAIIGAAITKDWLAPAKIVFLIKLELLIGFTEAKEH